MSTRAYSCNVPEIRSEDHINRLLVGAAFFLIAAAVLAALTLSNLTLPVLPWVTGTLAALFTLTSGLFLLVWTDVHNDGG